MSITFTAQWKTANGTQFGAEIGLNAGNAATVLGLLGYPEQAGTQETSLGIGSLPDAFGQLDGGLFLGRVLVARGLLDAAADDEGGLPGTAEGGAGTGQARFTDLGREPARLEELLGELETVARDADAHGGVVAWG